MPASPAHCLLTALTVLDLGGNSIGEESLHHLAPALARLTALRRLYLGTNGVHESAAAALRARLPASVCEALVW